MLKRKELSVAKQIRQGDPGVRIVFGSCLACMDCTASPAALDKERSPGLARLCRGGDRHRSHLPRALLSCVGPSCVMNLPSPSGTSLLLRWGHLIAQICCHTVTHGEHQHECVLPELSQVPSSKKRISLLFYFFLTGDSRGASAPHTGTMTPFFPGCWPDLQSRGWSHGQHKLFAPH